MMGISTAHRFISDLCTLGILTQHEGDDYAILSIRILNAVAELSANVRTSKDYLQESLRLGREKLGKNHAEYAKCLIDMAELYESLGDIRTVIEWLLAGHAGRNRTRITLPGRPRRQSEEQASAGNDRPGALPPPPHLHFKCPRALGTT